MTLHYDNVHIYTIQKHEHAEAPLAVCTVIILGHTLSCCLHELMNSRTGRKIPDTMGCGALAAPSLSLSSILSEAAICEGLSSTSAAGSAALTAGSTSAAAACTGSSLV